MISSASNRSELAGVVHAFRLSFLAIGLLSCVLNLLMLTGSLFMLEVYDRVLPSRSVPTLLGFVVLLLVLMSFQGALEYVRTRALVRIGGAFDEAFAKRTYLGMLALSLRTMGLDEGGQAVRDVDTVRGFFGGPGVSALFDLPWVVVYVAICFFLHSWIGYAALAGAAVLICLSIATEILTHRKAREIALLSGRRGAMLERSRRNAEVLFGMGFTGRFAEIWSELNRRYLDEQTRLVDRSAAISTVSRTFRQLLQSLVLALGAYLVIRQELSPGSIIAGSIIAARALAPIEQSIANWKGFVSTRDAWGRLNRLLTAFPDRPLPLELPAPKAKLEIEALSIAPPGSDKLVLADIALTIPAGSALAVIGPSGAGKSSFARGLVGVWRPSRGKVRLDGAALDQWPEAAIARHIGYLPQDIELFSGTVAQNIARFAQAPDAQAIIAAAEAADVHALILSLPQGYETLLGEGGANLSAGQRQRIALARALFGQPFLVVLDEPNSNLDAEGEAALTAAINGVRSRGGITVVVAHRPSVLAAVDLVAVVAEGRLQAFGPRDEVMSRLSGRPPQAQPLKVVNDEHRAR